MNRAYTQAAIEAFQTSLFEAIKSASYNGEKYSNGRKAKEALIRSQTLIMNIHESTKTSFNECLLENSAKRWQVHPPIGRNSPELKVYGKLKGKTQDLVYLCEKMEGEIIKSGPNQGERDRLGLKATESSIIIGVRSQLSSVDNNFDTLMERAFAETLNLRLRAPALTMGEVYLLPIYELDNNAMEDGKVSFKKGRVKVERFIRTFASFSNRKFLGGDSRFKYDATALLLVDLAQTPARLIFSKDDFKSFLKDHTVTDMFERQKVVKLFGKICGEGFDQRLLSRYVQNAKKFSE